MADLHGGSPFSLLPSLTFATHVLTCLTEQSRKALRIVCKDSRGFVNGEVKGACVSGSLIGSLTFQRIMESCPQLNYLIFVDAEVDIIGSKKLAHFLNEHSTAEGLPIASGAKLQKLDVKRCSYAGAADMKRLIAAFPQLQSLRASRLADGSHLRTLLPISNFLTELDLGDDLHNILGITDESLALLPRMSALRSFNLKRCIHVTDGAVTHLSASHLPNLTSLDLSYTQITGILGFETLSKLRSLVVVGCRAFGDAGMAAVCAFHAATLRTLNLHGTAVQPYGTSLWHLAQANELEVLDLGTSWEVDSEGLAALSRCRALADLRLGNFNLHRQQQQQQQLPQFGNLTATSGNSGGSAATVPSLANLLRLSLGGMYGQYGLDGLLRSLPRLKRVELAGLGTAHDRLLAQLVESRDGAAAALEELHLARSGPELTAKGLMQLTALPALRRLTLVDCPCAAAATIKELVHAVRSAGRELQAEVISMTSIAPFLVATEERDLKDSLAAGAAVPQVTVAAC